MQDVYNLLRPVFDGPIFRAALREAGRFRQAHVAAAIRKEPDSARFGMQTIRASHLFNAAIIEAMVVQGIPDSIIEGLGYHSFLFFGINPTLYAMAILAVNGVEDFSVQRAIDITASLKKLDIDEVIRGEENPTDIIMWMFHIGNNLATYLTKCSQD